MENFVKFTMDNVNMTNSVARTGYTLADWQKMSIEGLAEQVKFAGLKDYQREYCENLLIRRLSGKAHQGWAVQTFANNQCFAESYNADKYSGEIMTKAYNYAIFDFGREDSKTGKRILFEKLFWKAFALKNCDQVSEHLRDIEGEEQKAKGEDVKSFVLKVANNNGKKHLVPRMNFLNQERVMQILELVGATEEEKKTAEHLLSSCKIMGDVCYDEAGEESSSYLSDNHIIDRYDAGDRALDSIVSVFEMAMLGAKTEKDKQTLKAYMTLFVINYCPSDNYNSVSALQSFVDKELLLQLMVAEDENEVLMNYLEVQARGLRHRKKRAQELLNAGYAMAYGCGEASAA